MPDVFISYKKEEREIASTLAARLTEAGYDVWWDDALLAGERYEDEIAAVLDRSHAVVVLWSRQSVKSEWVKAEAEAARQQKKALPVIIDDMPPTQMPLLYRGMHAARFEGWTGETTHAGYVELIGSIRDRIGDAKGPELTPRQAEARLAETASEAVRTIVEQTADRSKSPSPPKKPIPPRRMVPLIVAAVLAIAALASVLGYWQYTENSTIDAANARCAAWAGSDALDWYTGVPRFDDAVLPDCVLAAERRPRDGDALGRLAMIRLVQGQTLDDALTLANRGIENRGAVANYVMGLMYERGLRLQYDLPRAGGYFKAASDLGLARGAGSLCLLGIDTSGQVSGVISSLAEAAGWCETARSKNDVLGLIGKGYVLETGFAGTAVDPAGAAVLYQAAADRGNDEAAVRLGILYHRGVGVPQDVPRATSLYRQAAEHDDPAGLRSLGLSYEIGEGVLKDELEAARLYEKASGRRDIPALLLAGYGIDPSIAFTARIMRDIDLLASSPTVATAQRLRGQLFTRGLMRVPDPAQAEREFTACADTGNALCLVALGNFYEFGTPTGRQPDKAADYYRQASVTGSLYGQYWWAYALDWGIGVARDPARAIEFYRLAAAQGHLTSINRLAQLGQPVQ